jgi:RNA polymerase sigma-70 factor (ECF subfamily)
VPAKPIPFPRTGADDRAESDAVLLAAVAAGDLGALGTVYDRHARDVWRVVARVMSGSGDVDDVVHATFLKLPELARSFDGRPSAKNWLCGIAVRLALRRGRTVERFTRMLSRFARAPWAQPTADPETQAILGEDLATLQRALEALPPKKRAVVVLVELQGMPQEEVAEVLGIPAATVRTRLFSARRALREAMGLGAATASETAGDEEP